MSSDDDAWAYIRNTVTRRPGEYAISTAPGCKSIRLTPITDDDQGNDGWPTPPELAGLPECHACTCCGRCACQMQSWRLGDLCAGCQDYQRWIQRAERHLARFAQAAGQPSLFVQAERVIHTAACRTLDAELAKIRTVLADPTCNHGRNRIYNWLQFREIVTADRLRGRRLCQRCSPQLTPTSQTGVHRGPVTCNWVLTSMPR